jgi:hypothetical protein
VKVRSLVDELNVAARRTLQTDSSPLLDGMTGAPKITTNASPLFVLDDGTGKLTFQLAPGQTRSLMLRHVREVRTKLDLGIPREEFASSADPAARDSWRRGAASQPAPQGG